MKYSPFNSKHVVFICDVCLKNVAQAASQCCKSRAVCYLHRLHLKMPEGFYCSAIFVQLCSLFFLTPTLMILNRDYLTVTVQVSAHAIFQDPYKILRLGRVVLCSLIISSVCYVRVGIFFNSYDPPFT